MSGMNLGGAPLYLYSAIGLTDTPQLLLTLLMYLISRKFHPAFGIPGTEVHGTPTEQKRDEGKGWEW